MVIVVPLLPCGAGLHDYTVYIADQEQIFGKVKRRISLTSVRLLHRYWFSSSRMHEQNVMHKSNNFLFLHEIFVLEVLIRVIFKTWMKIYFWKALLSQHNILCCDSANVGAELNLPAHILRPRGLYKRCALSQIEHSQPRPLLNTT